MLESKIIYKNQIKIPTVDDVMVEIRRNAPQQYPIEIFYLGIALVHVSPEEFSNVLSDLDPNVIPQDNYKERAIWFMERGYRNLQDAQNFVLEIQETTINTVGISTAIVENARVHMRGLGSLLAKSLPLSEKGYAIETPTTLNRTVKPTIKKLVVERDMDTCRYCNKQILDYADLHIDHVYPVRKGGQTRLNNLITACLSCNMKKRAHIYPDIEKRIVPLSAIWQKNNFPQPDLVIPKFWEIKAYAKP